MIYSIGSVIELIKTSFLKPTPSKKSPLDIKTTATETEKSKPQIICPQTDNPCFYPKNTGCVNDPLSHLGMTRKSFCPHGLT